MPRLLDNYFWCGLSVYAWIVLLVIGLFVQPGCFADSGRIEPLPRVQPCTAFEADIRPHYADPDVPSIQPAQFGVRIIVESSYDPFMGSSVPVPGGRMVWNVWVYHWMDGDHLGAIGRMPDWAFEQEVPVGGMCRWYDPL